MKRRELLASAAVAAIVPPPRSGGRKRLRDLGLSLGLLEPGPNNAITDVAGVTVGHTTLVAGDPPLVVGRGPVRTGVTVVLPRGTFDGAPCRAGAAILNGNGEMTGVVAIRRTGSLATPICLTGTGNVGIVHAAVMRMHVARTIAAGDELPSPVVAECWDAIGDIQGRHLREDHVRAAIESAAAGHVSEGSVGGGTGMTCYGFKGGVGTASRRTAKGDGGFSVGVLVNANHGSRRQLTIAGVPVGVELAGFGRERRRPSSSIVMIAATDAPLESRQLERLATRLGLGLARTGATANTSSGDLMLAFSTSGLEEDVLEDEHITPLYQATVEATEEAVLNALAMAEDMIAADGSVVPALPLDAVVRILRRRGALR